MAGLGRSQNGYALLIVLVAIVILMLLYFVQIDTFFGPGLPTEPKGIEEHPWVLQELLVPEGEEVPLPKGSKLELYELIYLSAPVSRNESDRGTILLTFETDGRVHGHWQCTYDQDGVDYHVDAQMSGNIDVKRTWRDPEGQKDKSRLFFIARGRYTKTPVGNVDAAGGETGRAWLTGWIDPDRSTTGHVTLTTDQRWAAAYAFADSDQIPSKD